MLLAATNSQLIAGFHVPANVAARPEHEVDDHSSRPSGHLAEPPSLRFARKHFAVAVQNEPIGAYNGAWAISQTKLATQASANSRAAALATRRLIASSAIAAMSRDGAPSAS